MADKKKNHINSLDLPEGILYQVCIQNYRGNDWIIKRKLNAQRKKFYQRYHVDMPHGLTTSCETIRRIALLARTTTATHAKVVTPIIQSVASLDQINRTIIDSNICNTIRSLYLPWHAQGRFYTGPFGTSRSERTAPWTTVIRGSPKLIHITIAGATTYIGRYLEERVSFFHPIPANYLQVLETQPYWRLEQTQYSHFLKQLGSILLELAEWHKENDGRSFTGITETTMYLESIKDELFPRKSAIIVCCSNSSPKSCCNLITANYLRHQSIINQQDIH